MMTTAMCVLGGLLLVGVSIPLIRRSVPPNQLYGFRTPKTLGDSRIWYDANEFSGRMLLRAGVITVLGTLALAPAPLGVGEKAFADAAVVLGSVLWATAVSLAHLRTL